MSGRLIQNIGDVRATDELLAAVERLHDLDLPFGFTREDWRKVRGASAELSELLRGDDDLAAPKQIIGSDVAGADVAIGSDMAGAGEPFAHQAADIYEEGEMGEEAVEEIKQLCRQLRRLLKSYV